jgi:hypothetical protein
MKYIFCIFIRTLNAPKKWRCEDPQRQVEAKNKSYGFGTVSLALTLPEVLDVLTYA